MEIVYTNKEQVVPKAGDVLRGCKDGEYQTFLITKGIRKDGILLVSLDDFEVLVYENTPSIESLLEDFKVTFNAVAWFPSSAIEMELDVSKVVKW